jgi:hypothetical protein
MKDESETKYNLRCENVSVRVSRVLRLELISIMSIDLKDFTKGGTSMRRRRKNKM